MPGFSRFDPWESRHLRRASTLQTRRDRRRARDASPRRDCWATSRAALTSRWCTCPYRTVSAYSSYPSRRAIAPRCRNRVRRSEKNCFHCLLCAWGPAFPTARGPHPRALARRLRASLGPQALISYFLGPPLALSAPRLARAAGALLFLLARGAPPRSRSAAPRLAGRRRFSLLPFPLYAARVSVPDELVCLQLQSRR